MGSMRDIRKSDNNSKMTMKLLSKAQKDFHDRHSHDFRHTRRLNCKKYSNHAMGENHSI